MKEVKQKNMKYLPFLLIVTLIASCGINVSVRATTSFLTPSPGLPLFKNTNKDEKKKIQELSGDVSSDRIVPGKRPKPGSIL